MSFLSHLKDLKIEEVQSEPKRSAVAAKDRNPGEEFMGIRIWKNGEVYPSKALVDKLNLEYVPVTITMVPVTKDGQPVTEDKEGTQVPKMKREYTYPDSVGNALDVVDTSEWLQYPKDQKRMLVVGLTPKNSDKVDLFGSTKYTEEGQPVTSVMTQGASTFGKETLLPAIAEIYSVEPNEEGFIDLEIVIEHDLASLVSNGIFLIPKEIKRGKDAGKADYERRENINIYPLVPSILMEPTVPTEKSSFDEGAVADGGAIAEQQA
jgi:hypothetical protein